MRTLVGSSKISAVAAAAAAVCLLCSGQPARAGGGGADLASLQGAIGTDPTGSNGLCSLLGIGPNSNFMGSGVSLTNSPCPTLPTITQAVLQYAGLGNLTPAGVRSAPFGNIPVANYVDADNASRPPGLKCLPSATCTDPLTGFNGTQPVGFTLPIDLSVTSTLQPVAYIPAANSTSAATPTQLSDNTATAPTVFLYAVGGLSAHGATVNNSQADSAVFFYENLQRTHQAGVAAKFSLPLTLLNNDGSETFVPAVLQFKIPAAGNAPCSASTVVSTLWPKGISPTAIGVNCAVVFGATQLSETSHAVFEVTVSLLITHATDPNYFPVAGAPFPTLSALPSAFNADLAFTPPNCPGQKCILGFNKKTNIGGVSIGVAPSAGPLGSPSATTAANYSLCASLPTDNSGPLPSAAAFYAIAADGVVHVSSALDPTPPGIVCPAM